MSDFAFLERPETKPDWREKYSDVLRDCFANQAKHLQDDAEKALDYARDLLTWGIGGAKDELDELETFARGLTLAVMLLKNQANKG